MPSPAADKQDHNVLWRRINLRDGWASLDLDSHSLLMMLKGALPPTIVIAISQSDAIADITLTIGYLAALMSITSQCLMPRAKFVKIMLFSLLATCVAASLCCLVNYCAVKARLHSLPANASESVRTGYNSDACVVAAIWLIVLIWVANAIRAWRPTELQDPMVAFSIFSTVTITRVGTFATVSEGLSFISRLLKTFMIGYAIASAVSLFILPITSRGNVFHDMRDYVAQVQTVLQCQIGFLKQISQLTVPGSNHGLLSRTRTALDNDDPKTDDGLQEKQNALNASMTKLNALHTKLNTDLLYSKYEIACGKLSAEDLATAAVLFRDILLPLSGMSMLPEILEMMTQEESSSQDDEGDENIESKRGRVQKIIETLHLDLLHTLHFATAGMQYFLLALQLTSPQRLNKDDKKWDEESTGESLNPLQPNFISRFEQALHDLYNRQRRLPWEQEQDISNNEKPDENLDAGSFASNSDVQYDFFLLLYMQHMQRILLNATLELVKFADSKVSDGTMKSNRLIFPKQESIKTWFSLQTDQKNWPHASSPDEEDKEQKPESFLPNPEHLPPANAWEKASNSLRYISQTIRSDLSVFGFRVAAASFCVAILAFLRQTQQFFFHGRCIWAMIVIVIGMTPTSGQMMYGFMARILATIVSVVLSLIVWYIVDQKTPGVIIFLYLANVFEYYFYVKKPQYFGPTVISIVTLNVIVGYELQARKLGLAVATSNDQPYYPIYIFGPYKLAAVAAGCGISFVWAIFPYPITARSKLRKLLGEALFVLAKFYGAMHNTIEIWMSSGVSGRHGKIPRTLADVRQKLFKEEMMLLTTLRTLSHFTTFEPPIGGRFPKDKYDCIISETQRLLTCMSLMVSTTQNLEALYPSRPSTVAAGQDENWISHLATIAFKSADFKSHTTSSLLCHFSASLINGQPLPPYLRTPYSFPLARQIQKIDRQLLNIRHVQDPAFSAFLSLEVLRSVVTWTLGHLLKDVKTLVGELNVGLYAVPPESLRLMSDDSETRDSATI